ncbi:hypothetical protein D3C71_2006150 [compost metagenome]
MGFLYRNINSSALLHWFYAVDACIFNKGQKNHFGKQAALRFRRYINSKIQLVLKAVFLNIQEAANENQLLINRNSVLVPG